MIATYLVHHGYCATAEAFARSTGQEFGEEVASIKNRQRKKHFKSHLLLKFAAFAFLFL